eukprot:SAG11_NODE_9764_length_882_cov_1.583653_1_plen_55_part_10
MGSVEVEYHLADRSPASAGCVERRAVPTLRRLDCKNRGGGVLGTQIRADASAMKY